eukprot:GHVL01020868.1.p1 GENE.GHVL01020868.1~~GHVL01020868.1.p1  ORF type:complete len:842 (+),score=217.36 GHVL01020868.1:693-3218(+)
MKYNFICALPLTFTCFLLSSLNHNQLPPFFRQNVTNGVSVCAVSMFLLSFPVQFWFGRQFHIGAFKAIMRYSPNMDVLISLSTNISFIFSTFVLVISGFINYGSHEVIKDPPHFFETSCILISVILLGKMLEMQAKSKTMGALNELMDKQPSSATLFISPGNEEQIPIELIEIHDYLRVVPGGVIPADGYITSDGTSSVNESIITGESRDIVKKKGDLVLGGSTCVEGSMIIEAIQVGSNTALGQIIKLVENAQTSKAPMQNAADTIAGYFVPMVLLVSCITILSWTYLVYNKIVIPPDTHGNSDNIQLKNAVFVLRFGVAVLSVACPCALGLATPTAVMVATGLSASFGVLIKGGIALELGANVETVVLDKTGTITEGKPSVVDVSLLINDYDIIYELIKKNNELIKNIDIKNNNKENINNIDKENINNIDKENIQNIDKENIQNNDDFINMFDIDNEIINNNITLLYNNNIYNENNNIYNNNIYNEKDVYLKELIFWWIIGSCEQSSEHPLGICLLEYSKKILKNIKNYPIFDMSKNFKNIQGEGIECTILDKFDVRIGSLSRLNDNKEINNWATPLQLSGCTIVLMLINNNIIGGIAMKDTINKDTISSIKYLQKNTDVWMCTGDARETAEAVAKQVGIPLEKVRAQCLPAEKLELLESLKSDTNNPANGHSGYILQERGRRSCFFCRRSKGVVCMVGDGINDSPALAKADLGIAIGAGAHVTVSAADVVLVRSSLSDLVAFMALAKSTFITILRNFFWAFIFNLITVPMAAGCFYPAIMIPPVIAGVLMAGSSVLVVLSSLSLKLFKRPILENFEKNKKNDESQSLLVNFDNSQDIP